MTVWVLREADGVSVVREQRITLGEAFGERVGATQGLRGGERVVVRGNEALRDGQRVVPQRAGPLP